MKVNRLFVIAYLWFCELVPRFKKTTRKWMYQFMAWLYKKNDWVFMNYGFYPMNGECKDLYLQDKDEADRIFIQLYHFVTSDINLKDKRVLEVGSGRGGGASMIKRYKEPKEMIGLDYSGNAVKLCHRFHSVEGLNFVRGDAENLPFDDHHFDAVINVESSHCYASVPEFFRQVHRVLRPGGHFLYCDFRDSHEMQKLEHQLANSGLEILKKTDITPNILEALEKDTERRKEYIRSRVPKILHKLFFEFAGVENSVIYKEFKTRKTLYYSFVLQKKN